MKRHWVPRWIWLVLLLLGVWEAGTLALFLAGRLPGSQRNMVALALVGGILVLVAIAAYLVRYRSERLPSPPERGGLGLLILISLGLVGIYAWYLRPFITLPYDLANWSEGFFVTDIIKWRVGAKIYQAASDSNSSTYPPGATAVSFFLARLSHQSASIVFYRFLQQVYLLIAAMFAAAATWNLLGLAEPERQEGCSRWWLVFFVLAAFLLAINPITNAFVIYLHGDALAILATTVAFWLLTQFASTRNPRWLWAMAFVPAAGFLVKHYVAIWAVVYLLYFWLDGESSTRRIVSFGVACFGVLAVTIGISFAHWGRPFGYWVFYELSAEIIAPDRLFGRFSEAALATLLGATGGAVLLRGEGRNRFLGMWLGWLVMVLMGAYTAGVAYLPTHQGPATMVGGCLFLAALAVVWPHRQAQPEARAQQWLQMGVGLLLFTTLFVGMSHPFNPHWSVPPDLQRYVDAIQREFQGLPTDRVLTDYGDWVYLRENVLMRDRAPILLSQHTTDYGILGRLRSQAYARILLHVMPSGEYSYQYGRAGIVVRELLRHYREVRRIPRVKGAEDWPVYPLTLGDVAVFEPLPPAESSAKIPSHENDRATR